jgi:hypothetical protein
MLLSYTKGAKEALEARIKKKLTYCKLAFKVTSLETKGTSDKEMLLKLI